MGVYLSKTKKKIRRVNSQPVSFNDQRSLLENGNLVFATDSLEVDSYGDLREIPRDLLTEMFSMLSVHDLFNLSCVSKGMYNVVVSNPLWKHLYQKRWGKGKVRKDLNLNVLNWRQLYFKRATNNLDPRDDPFWETISVHEKDTSLDGDFASHTWELKLPPGTSYRAFRIVQTGKNKYSTTRGQKDEWSNVLVASGLELYGYLSEGPTTPPVMDGEFTEDGRRMFPYEPEKEIAKEKKGIIHALGGYPSVRVYASSLSPGKYIENFISQEDVYVWTRNERYSWFAIDVGYGRKVEPTHYSLKYGSGGNFCCPRNWLLQGTNSIDILQSEREHPLHDPRWDTLRLHRFDTSLDSDWAVCTWELPRDSSPKFYRVVQIGKNKYQLPRNEEKDRWSDVLVVSGFELYGSLLEKRKKKTPKEKKFPYNPSPNKDYSVQMDKHGIIHSLGASQVKCFASSSAVGKSVQNFISKEPQHNWTLNEAFAWYAVDLGEDRAVSPSHYTLRYGSGGNLCCPRNWVLQATNNINAIKSSNCVT